MQESTIFLVQENLLIKCNECSLYPIEPYKCKNNKCNAIFCELHLDKDNKKCLKCKSDVEYDRNLNNILESIKIKCNKCQIFFNDAKSYNEHYCIKEKFKYLCKFCNFYHNEQDKFVEHVFSFHKYNILLEFKKKE